ncbi:uncharacterized protein LOC131931537 [Physella acuta]|uniref:uncharacterized protein LOC131931537 n=1 Tax=Physella acuta TaxID=109671 RepID=UPI0027DD2456|nr:uncharacterized protein LOC131931537 [Physella acuta]
MDALIIKRMAHVIYIVLIIITLTLDIVAKADPAQLLERLKDRSWPWFGDCYTNLCPDPTKNPSYCFNLRPQPESILERAGLPNTIQLTTDLEVIFSSPKEDVDVCGKAQPMEEVKAFKLPESGRAVKSLLKRGSEIYRSRPKIKFGLNANDKYSLLIYDVGLLCYRGYWRRIQTSNGDFQGEEKWPYQPPANPLPVVNPILIILFKQRPDVEYNMGDCFKKRPNKVTANNCRDAVSTSLGDGHDIVGLQVYYTDGSSMFEKYMACAEGFICDSQCFGKFQEYAESNLPQLDFMDLSLSALDMYVNIYIYVTVAQDMQNCCDGKLYFSRKDSFRARPGDNFKVSSFSRMCYPECHTDWIIEFSSTETNILGDENYYAVFAFVPWKVNDRLEVKFVWNETNIKLPEYTGGSTTSRKSYASNGAGERHMYILFFSYPAIFTGYITLR